MWKGSSDMSKKKNKKPTALELAKSVRGSWNGVNPVTRIQESKKKKKPKYKNEDREEWDDGE